MRAETAASPDSGRAAASGSANASPLPRSAWKVRAATPSAASSSSRMSAQASVATANVAAFDDMSGSASPGSIDEPALRRQREPELGEHREVARADAPEVAQRGQRGLAQQRRERVGHLRPAPAGAGGHLREPHQQRGAHHLVRQRVAEPARVAAQQPHRVGAQVAVDRDVAVRARRRSCGRTPRAAWRRHGGGVAGGHALARPRARASTSAARRARRRATAAGARGSSPMRSAAMPRHSTTRLDGSAGLLVFRPVEGEGRT